MEIKHIKGVSCANRGGFSVISSTFNFQPGAARGFFLDFICKALLMGNIIGMRHLIKFRRLFFALLLGLLAIRASAQTNVYLFSGAKTNITLNSGFYNITAYGAQGSSGNGGGSGGPGAEMSAEFYLSGQTTLTLLVGGGGLGGVGYPGPGGGGGGSFVVNGSTPLIIAGGGGGGGNFVANTSGNGLPGLSSTTGGAGDTGYGGGGAAGSAGGGGGSGGEGSGGGGGYEGGGATGFNGGGGASFINGGQGGSGGGPGDGTGGGNGGFGGGGGAGYAGGGGGGGYSGGGAASFNGGGGGGSYVDSSAIAILAEVSGAGDGSVNGEITISTSAPPDYIVIVTQPSSQTVAGGQTANFSVSAVNSPPFTYQWLLDGTNIAGATNATYSIPDVQTNNDGAYSVVISDATTNITSSNAVLTVIYPPPVIVSQSTNEIVVAGSNAVFSVNATSYYPMSFQWQFNGTNLVDGGQISGSTNSMLTISPATDANAGSYQVIAYNDYGAVTSSIASLIVLDPIQITAQPTNQFLLPGSNATFTVMATGTAPGYQWYFNGTPLTDGGNVSGSMSATLTLANIQTTNGGIYVVVVTNGFSSSASSNAILAVINPTPAIISPPVSLAVAANSNAVFSIYATNYFPLSFQWQFNGTNLPDGGQISGSLSSNLMITGAQAANAGPYQVIVFDSYGAITSSIVSLTVEYPVQITGQPVAESLLAGSNATFTVTAMGIGLSYQWLFNGLPLTDGGNVSGSQTATLNLAGVQTGNDGNYSVLVTNLASSITSSNALLTVYNPAQITVPPVTIGVPLGNNGTFKVVATGTALGYQWYFNGTPLTDGGQISGSAAPTLTISNVQGTNAGNYSVSVTNLLSGTNSLPVSLILASIRYVNLSNTTPQAPYTNWSMASTDIQSAINVSSFGDLILVSNGVYQTGGELVTAAPGTNRVAITVPITVQSVGGPGVTTIQGYQMPVTNNGPNAIRCAYITNGATLSGFTLTGGATPSSQNGGGVYGQSTACIVSNCVITGNSASANGAGVYQGTLFDCVIFNNSLLCQSMGGGGGDYGGNLVDCIIISNVVSGPSVVFGGGTANANVTNCAIADNVVVPPSPFVNNSGGGGAYQGTLVNCTITGNSGQEGGGTVNARLINCIDYYNTASTGPNYFQGTFTYCCTTPNPGGTGNIFSPPLLAGIYEISTNSPCTGKGNPAVTSGVDINGNPWANPPSIGCEEPDPGSMTGNINMSIIAPTTNVPVGYPGNFQAYITSPVYNSAWNFGDGTNATNMAYASHTWSAIGNYTVTLTATNDSYPTGQMVTLNVNVYQPTVFYVVNTNKTPVAPYDTWAKAATNIQSAVNVAIPGGTVLVSNGVYNAGVTASADGVNNRVAVTKPVTLQSVNGPAFTLITGNGQFRSVYLTNGAVLNGFTVTNGFAVSATPGAGIYCVSNAFVENCLIINNRAVNSSAYSGTLSNCTIMGSFGDGDQYSRLYNCTISSNSAWGAENATLNGCFISTNASGGARFCTLYSCIVSNNGNYGIYQTKATACQIFGTYNPFGDSLGFDAFLSQATNCLLDGNGSYTDGGAYSSTVVNCTIVNHYQYGESSCTAQNCIIYYDGLNLNGGTLNDCCTFPLPASGFGNFTNPPALINLTNDFHLQSTSPCINSGNNAYVATATDLDGNGRIRGGTVDVGAYEYQTPTSVISYAYLQQYGLPTDGSVDYADLDGNGFTVYQDWIAGLNPTNPASGPVMLSPPTGNTTSGITVTWQSVSGVSYLVQRTTNLPAPFSTVKSNIVGNAGTTSYTDTSATNGMMYFYRVGLQAP
jgi:hypothetical protein